MLRSRPGEVKIIRAQARFPFRVVLEITEDLAVRRFCGDRG